MAATRKQYTKEFKHQSVRLVAEQGLSIAQAARDLGLNDNVLARWKKELTQQGEQAFPGAGRAQEDELAKLRREVEVLRHEREILKSRGYLLATASVRYQFIQEHKGQFGVGAMCRVLGLSRSGYYAWRNQSLRSQKQQENEDALSALIQAIYQESHGGYGNPRVHRELQGQGIHCGRKRVARLMQQHKLSALKPNRFVTTTDSAHTL